MREIDLLYWNAGVINVGDMLNVAMAHKLFGLQVKRLEPFDDSKFSYILSYDAVFVGSMLERVVAPRTSLKTLLRVLGGKCVKPLKVWGSGFLYPDSVRTDSYLNSILGGGILYRKLDIHALRGHKTKAILESLLGRRLDSIALGDPGLLYGKLLDSMPPKRYKVGIIPHIGELTHPTFATIAGAMRDSVLISPSDDPLRVLQTIASCESILSSAMHGLIIADGIGIPNKRLIASDSMHKQSGKFEDYYSVYGISPQVLDVRGKDLGSYDWAEMAKGITRDYAIPHDRVQSIKQDLLECFPF